MKYKIPPYATNANVSHYFMFWVKILRIYRLIKASDIRLKHHAENECEIVPPL